MACPAFTRPHHLFTQTTCQWTIHLAPVEIHEPLLQFKNRIYSSFNAYMTYTQPKVWERPFGELQKTSTKHLRDHKLTAAPSTNPKSPTSPAASPSLSSYFSQISSKRSWMPTRGKLGMEHFSPWKTNDGPGPQNDWAERNRWNPA